MMRDSSWKRPLIWALLTFASVGFLLSLGIHLVAWGGINVDRSLPWLVQAVRIGAFVGLIIGIPANIYLFWNKQWRATYILLPVWLRLVLHWSVLLLVGYWLAYSAAMFGHYPGTEDAAATMHLRDEACRWLPVYGMFLQVIIHFSWGWNFLKPRSVPPLAAPR